MGKFKIGDLIYIESSASKLLVPREYLKTIQTVCQAYGDTVLFESDGCIWSVNLPHYIDNVFCQFPLPTKLERLLDYYDDEAFSG